MTHSRKRGLPVAVATVAAVVVTALAFTAQTGLGQRRSRSRSDDLRTDGRSLSDYDVLTSRNIFLSTRRPGRAPTPLPATRPAFRPVVDTRNSWALRGILTGPEGYVAVIERQGYGTVEWVRTGQTAGGKRVVRIGLDAIWLENGSAEPLEVAVGSLLTGAGAGPPTTSTAVTSGTTPASAGAEPAGESILERLRRKRMQAME